MKPDNESMSRREFLKRAAVIAGGLVLAGAGVSESAGFFGWLAERKDGLLSEWRLNPAFRVREFSPNKIELYTHLGTGEVLTHRFSGLEADIFRMLAREEPVVNHLPSMAQRHGMSVGRCREKALSALHQFKRSYLVYTGEKMLVKIVEAG